MNCLVLKHNGEYNYGILINDNYFKKALVNNKLSSIAYKYYGSLKYETELEMYGKDTLKNCTYNYRWYDRSRMFIKAEISQKRFYYNFKLIPRIVSITEVIQRTINGDW